MANDKPNIQAFEKAILRLEEGLARFQRDVDNTQIRDGLLQRFEFTYELGHRMLKRFLEYASPRPEQFDAMAFGDMIRTANEQGLLLGNWTNWRRYREMHGKTSDSYDEAVAREVVAGIPAFLEETRYLRDQLKRRIA
jgi:nucleotidyltransferase substrate binding protein (TIGR01987 family)